MSHLMRLLMVSFILGNLVIRPGRAAPIPTPRTVNSQFSRLHLLERDRVPEADRRQWNPLELVAILGDQQGRHWQYLENVSYSPNGKWIAAKSCGHVYLWEAPKLRFKALLPVEASFIQFVTEGNSLLTCGPDRIVRLWDVSSDIPRGRIIMRDVPIVRQEILSKFSHVAVSPDGKKLLVATGEGFTFYSISPAPPKEYFIPFKGKTLLEAAFSPDSSQLVTLKAEVVDCRGFLRDPWLKNQEVTLWNVSGEAPKVRCALTGPSWQWGPLAFSPDGKILVCGANIWDCSDGRPKFRAAMNGQEENVRGCLFLPDSRYALIPGYNSKDYHFYLRVRDMHERVPRILQSVTPAHAYGSYQTMALSPDAKHLAVGEGNYLHVWELKDEKIQVLPPSSGHTQDIKAISFGACGNLMATIAQDATLRLWDLDGSRPHMRLVHKQKFGFPWDTVALSPDGTKLAAGYQGGNDGFTLWEISRSGLRVRAEHKKGGRFLSFSPDSKLLFASNGRDSHKFIDVSKPMESVQSLDLGRRGAQSFLIEAIAISPDWQTLAVGGIYELELWQRTESSWQKQTNAKAECHVKSLSFAARSGTLLVGGGTYKKPEVHLYDLTGDSPQSIAAFSGLRDVAVSVTASSTAKLFAATDETGRVVVWSASGKKVHEWTFPGPVHCVSFAPDGRHLALGNGDGTVYILRLAVPKDK